MFPPDTDEATNISNENNFSGWAAFKALSFVLKYFAKDTSDATLVQAKNQVDTLISGLEKWFSDKLLPSKLFQLDLINQGGHVTFPGVYTPATGDQAFAVDCQTWGLTAMGQKKFDSLYGSGMAMKIWRNTKSLAGFYIGGKLAGVGYTKQGDQKIWSGEWTWGAINMAYKLSLEYGNSSNGDFAQELKNDADSMRSFLIQPITRCENGSWCSGGLVQSDGSMLYSNARFFIPWGWYANPIGATSSTGWMVFDQYQYNPFELGGGSRSTFYQQKCMNNPPSEDLLQALIDFYNY